jgi:hypothetical protein
MAIGPDGAAGGTESFETVLLGQRGFDSFTDEGAPSARAGQSIDRVDELIVDLYV